MNPLLKGAEQLRYYSPIYEPIYDEEDNVVDEEMIRNGTDILSTFIRPVHADGKPRYYRLRYPVHAKEHKRRWDTWLKNQLANSNPYRVKVSKIGRRVLFEVDPNFQTKRDKVLRRIQATLAREQQLTARASVEEIPGETDSQRLGREFVRQNYPFVETDEEYTQRVERSGIDNAYAVGETIYECIDRPDQRLEDESGDRYEER